MKTLVVRIFQFMDAKNENTRAFSERCGLANGTLNKAKNSHSGLSSDTIEKILLANPDLSADWLFDQKPLRSEQKIIESLVQTSSDKPELNLLELIIQLCQKIESMEMRFQLMESTIMSQAKGEKAKSE